MSDLISTVSFYKYQGTGNDFILIDNMAATQLDRGATAIIRRLCDRRFGIGADGLILLQAHPRYDFEMVYFNADGREGSMCGNGGRCAVAFAHFLGIVGEEASFLAVDGPHEARISDDGRFVELKMAGVAQVERGSGYYYLDTGSPHYVVFVDDLDAVDVVGEGRAIRYSDRFRKEGTNVNFVQIDSEGIGVATYERGVENETLSCGTGVTASAIAYYLQQPGPERERVGIRARGGQLEVSFRPQDDGFTDVWLCGPAEQVFQGTMELPQNK